MGCARVVSERISSLSRLVILFALQFGDRFVTGQADIPKSGPAAIENSNDRHAAVTVLDRSGLEHAQLDQPALLPAARVSTLATACRMLTTLAPRRLGAATGRSGTDHRRSLSPGSFPVLTQRQELVMNI